MIVIQRTDLDKGSVEVANLGQYRPWEPELKRFAAAVGRLGFRELNVPDDTLGRGELRFCSEQLEKRMVSVQTAERTHLRGHKWTLARDLPLYQAEFQMERGCLAFISRYTALLLASYGPQEEHLMQLWLAVYEIVANVLEHGHRDGQKGRLWIQLCFEEDGISGWIQDGCERFDPFEAATMSLTEKVLAGLNRGYGIEIIRRYLDGFDHEFNEKGNRINFKKRILR